MQKAARGLAGYLATKGARVEYLWLPDTEQKTGLDDYLIEHTVEELFRLVKPTQPPVTTQPLYTPPNQSATAQPRTSEAVQSLARLPRILDSVAEEVRSRGLVGEERLGEDAVLGAHLAAA